jgi:hypothetical protein
MWCVMVVYIVSDCVVLNLSLRGKHALVHVLIQPLLMNGSVFLLPNERNLHINFSTTTAFCQCHNLRCCYS